MSIKTTLKLAFACHSLAILLLIGFGGVYLLWPTFMPYHADALSRNWSEVEPAFQVIILALMRSAGGAWLATSLALALLLGIPFRQGQRWAYGAIPAIGVTVSLPALYATLSVRRLTPAEPPWLLVVVGMGLLLVGWVLSLCPLTRKPVPRSGTQR